MHLRLPGHPESVEWGQQPSVELYEPQEMQWTMRGYALLPSPRIRTAPQFPHLHSTVGLGVSSTGGTVGALSMSGAGTTLRVFCRRAGIAATSSKFGQLPTLISANQPCAASKIASP